MILERDEIVADYAPGTVETVVQHDGSILRLRKLAVDYDPLDRISALTYLQQRHALGDVVTGLFKVEPEGPDPARLDTVEAPLNGLGDAELRPGSTHSPSSTPPTASRAADRPDPQRGGAPARRQRCGSFRETLHDVDQLVVSGAARVAEFRRASARRRAGSGGRALGCVAAGSAVARSAGG